MQGGDDPLTDENLSGARKHIDWCEAAGLTVIDVNDEATIERAVDALIGDDIPLADRSSVVVRVLAALAASR